MVSHPVKAKVIPMDKTINTQFADYGPVITADESVMYFTSRRPGLSQKLDSTDGTYFEDIYVSYNINNKWTAPELLPSPLNTNDHDAVLAISSDGQKIFKYDAASNNGGILLSHLQGDKWTELKPLPENINSKDESERSIAISADENMIFFERDDTSDGNRDLYLTYKIKDGSWIDAEKLGPEVNSSFDEDGLFFHPDGKTLYFSSNGHSTMGGYDIFKSVYKDGKWSQAQNLGYPINTPDDDIFFVLSADGKHGYYSSIPKNGLGDLDICMIEMPVPEVPDTTKPFSALTLLTGSVTDKTSGLPLQASIQITDNTESKVITTLYTNSKTGKFIVSLPSGKNYGIAIVKDDYLFHSENFDLPVTHDFEKVTKNIKLQKVVKGSNIVLNNVFFDFNKSTLKKESIVELERVLRIMKDNPTMKVQIAGYTDNIGTAEYNLHLSELRAQEVAYFLMDRGIERNRVKAIGMGIAKPVASNKKADKDNPEGRKQNRRTEFTILEK
jgi:outer membrane protein OmpA-like peptidoglycan-associated protein